MITATQTAAPLAKASNPVPAAVISVAVTRIVFREPSRSDNIVIGMADNRLTV